MKMFGILVLVLGLGAVMATPAAAQQAERGTPEEAQALVASAIDLVEQLGIEVALASFNARDPRFVDRDLYIFVIGADGIVAAQAADPERVGMDARTLVDAEGNNYGTWLVEQATPEGVWIDYLRNDPLTGEDEPKSSWVVRHGDYIFGCGVYLAP
jgi:cytochrome c